MSPKRIRNFVKDGAKLYFRHTSVHGFRYALETHDPILKVFWIISIVLAFFACFTLIHDNLIDEQEKPTITTNEEIILDDLPAPAISILVPEVDASVYLRMRMPNSIRACDPKVNISHSKNLKKYLVVTKAIHKAVRRHYVPSDVEVGEFARHLENHMNSALFPRFCESMLSLNDTEKGNFVAQLTARIDTFLMVPNLDGMINDLLLSEGNYSYGDGCNVDRKQLRLDVVKEWMILNAPLSFKERHGFKCSER